MAAILSKFTVLCLFSYFVVYLFFLRLELILFYNRVVYYYARIFQILLPHSAYIYIYIYIYIYMYISFFFLLFWWHINLCVLFNATTQIDR